MATAMAGFRYKGRTDLWVMRGAPGTQVAGVFTQNKCPGAPVEHSKSALHAAVTNAPRIIVVNSGTANVFAGQKGKDAVMQTARDVGAAFDTPAGGVLLSSTGVIGQPLDASKLTAKLPEIIDAMSGDGWEDAARAIMTTDTYPKGATRTATINGMVVTLNGIAKGSGMIAPDMATMLGYIATDAAIAKNALQDMLLTFTRSTFNAITVDSDTSTSDTVLLAASGAAKHTRIEQASDPALADFKTALFEVMHDLALQIVKDGEGASKFVTVNVTGAISDDSAHIIGKSVANSPLVKTAIAGQDANWGRIVMAVGKAGEPAERDLLTVALGPHILAEKGQLSETYSEEAGSAYMKNAELVLNIDLGLGEGKAVIYTCDLTHGYIDINADYRS